MSNMREPVLKAVADVVKDHVGKAFASLRGRIDGLEAEVKALPKPERGEKGETGQEGIRGDIGPAGKDGINGKDGERGLDGINGDIGPEGKQGPSGFDGAAGKDGKDGLTIKGDPGKDADPVDEEALAAKILGKIVVPSDGKDGKDGLNGKDAPAVDTEALSASIVQKVLGLIPAPKEGLAGKDGASVDIETVKLLVLGEVNKAIDALPPPAAGRDGRDGRNGDIGLPGKDADEIDVLPGIDEGSAYPKGTRAVYRGGQIMAYRTTDPVIEGDIEAAGWQVIQNGIADVLEEMGPDGRTRITSYVMTNGKSLVTKLKIYVPQHKGVWTASNGYELGDYVTMAGAQWHSNRTNKDRPGTSDAWTLVVKRGSDGKDLTNGARQ